jgi:short-subunit dehydrogenase involved in D-alanine esterification of teichoic acids
MKLAITGHTSGIGKSLFNLFPDSMGFSRANGFNLEDLSVRKQVVELAKDCDVFVNNAYASQTQLLYLLWEQWKEKEKVIVNISSDAGDYNHNKAYPYAIYKRTLDDASLQLQQSKLPCKVMNIRPSYVDTPRVAHIEAKKMDPDDLALYIKYLLEMDRTFWIPVVTIYPR